MKCSCAWNVCEFLEFCGFTNISYTWVVYRAVVHTKSTKIGVIALNLVPFSIWNQRWKALEVYNPRIRNFLEFSCSTVRVLIFQFRKVAVLSNYELMKEAFVEKGKQCGGRPTDPREKYYNPYYKKTKGQYLSIYIFVQTLWNSYIII